MAAGPDDLAPPTDGHTNLQLDLVEPDGRPAPSFSTPPQATDDAPRIDLRTAIDDVRDERFHDVPDTVDIRTPLPSTVAGPSPTNPKPPPPDTTGPADAAPDGAGHGGDRTSRGDDRTSHGGTGRRAHSQLLRHSRT